MLKKVPSFALIFSVFLLALLLLFTNVNLVSAQETRDTQDCASNQVPEIGEILRLGLTPSLRTTEGVGSSPELRMTNGAEFSSQFRTANVEGLTPKSGTANAGSDPQLGAESDAQLSAKRVGQRAMYRLYNPYTGEHFYTADEQERDDVAAAGWNKESIGWVAPKTSSTPVYRLYNKYAWDHHYTPSADERDNLVKKGWIYEGIGWYSADEGSLFRAPVYRQYNPNAWVGTHNYTLSTSERDNLIKAGWRDEGVGYYGLDQSLMSAIDFDKDLKVTTTSKVYNGKAQTQTITSSNLKLYEDYIVEYANNKNVGTATITITGINGFYGEKVYTFKITQKTISQVKWGDLEFGYDGKAHIPTATAVGLCSGDSATVTVTASGNHTDTGTYTATATAISNKNYKLASGLKTDFRIGTKIDFDNKNKVTVDLSDETYTGSAITKQVSLAGLTKDKDYTVTYTNNVNVGTATLTIKGKGEYFGEKSYTFKITQKSLSGATITPEALTYNGSEQTAKISKVTLDGKTLKEGTDFQVTSGNKGTNAGTYEGLTLKGVGNYKDTASGSWAISSLDIKDAVVTLGNSLTYNGYEQTQNVAGVKVGNLTLTNDDYDLDGNTATNAGTYNTLKVNGKGNFAGSATVAFIISPLDIKDATIELDGSSLTYNAQTQTKTVTSVKLGELNLSAPADYAVEGNSAKDAGDHTITIKGQGNFTGMATGTFSIAQAEITIEWENTSSLIYDGTPQKPIAKVKSGTQGDDTITLSVSGAQTEACRAGETYGATVSIDDEASKRNYKIAEDDKATTFTISPLSISDATIVLDSNTLTYNASTQTKGVVSVKVGELTLTSSDYDLSGNTAKGAGDHTMTFTGKGNFTGTATTSFSINKAPLKIMWSNTSLTYDATAQSPTAEIESGKQGSDSITLNVSGAQTNANKAGESYTANVSLDETSQVNYAISENETTTFTIAKATPVAPTGLTSDAEVNQTLAVVDLPTLPTGFEGTLSWKESTTSTGSSPNTTINATVIYTPKDSDNYNSVEATVVVSVGYATYTVVYHGNGGATTDDKDEYTQKCEIGQGGTLTQNAFSQTGKEFAFWTIGTNDSGTITPASTLTYLDKHSLSSNLSTQGSTVHLYAYWINESAGKYWMGTASADYPDTVITKTQTQIDSSKTTASFWNNLYSSDNRLYTIWKYDEVLAFTNRFVEARIIQVGAHDSDGSNVTFMATHSLPTSSEMNSIASNVCGWINSSMYSIMNGEGGYVMTGFSNIKSVVKAVSKKSSTKSSGSWADALSNDTFWLISHSELVGVNNGWIAKGEFRNEGSQYTWCKANVTAPQGSNSALKVDKMRDKTNRPRNAKEDAYGLADWWQRSPHVYVSGKYTYDDDYAFGTVDGNGGLTDTQPFAATNGRSNWANYNLSIAPCFCF